MNRAIHSAFRRDLGRFIGALESFPPGDRALAARLGVAWDQFEDQLTHHHTGEHEIAWPALTSVGVSPELLEQMDEEHGEMAAALTAASRGFATLRSHPTAEQVATTLLAVRQLQTATVLHLDHEEAELEPVYLEKKDTPEIKAMGKAFGKVSPSRGGRFFAWLLDGAGPDEVAAIKSTVPGPVLSIISGVFGRGYRKDVASLWAS